MSGDAAAPESRPRHFCPSARQLRRWQRTARWRGERSTLKLLQRLEAEWHEHGAASSSQAGRGSWLLPYRADFRRTVARCDVATIRCYLASCPEEMIPLGVWLLGQCADRFQLHHLPAFCNDPSPQIRWHVAKALRRVEAWSLLDAMAEAFPSDARVQWYAHAPITHRPFAQRLTDFIGTVDDSHAHEAAGPSRMTWWALQDHWQGRPPKSVVYIRHLLWRIHRWVRGR